MATLELPRCSLYTRTWTFRNSTSGSDV